MKIVSACLAGTNCRYDGSNSLNEKVANLVKEGKAIPLCPEQLGGLPTPRKPCEQKGDRVYDKSGNDLTDLFYNGAGGVLKLAKLLNCKEAILKSYSPSCGCGKVYDGTFTHTIVKGYGVTAKLLQDNGINVKTEKEL